MEQDLIIFCGFVAVVCAFIACAIPLLPMDDDDVF